MGFRSVIFCEAVAIYGVIVAIILATKVEDVNMNDLERLAKNMHAGYAYFGAGIITGFANLVCGYVWSLVWNSTGHFVCNVM